MLYVTEDVFPYAVPWWKASTSPCGHAPTHHTELRRKRRHARAVVVHRVALVRSWVSPSRRQRLSAPRKSRGARAWCDVEKKPQHRSQWNWCTSAGVTLCVVCVLLFRTRRWHFLGPSFSAGVSLEDHGGGRRSLLIRS